MTSQNPKQDTLPNKFIGTALTPSEIASLRQDLKDAVAYAETRVKKRELTWLKKT